LQKLGEMGQISKKTYTEVLEENQGEDFEKKKAKDDSKNEEKFSKFIFFGYGVIAFFDLLGILIALFALISAIVAIP
jgi:uncharacterized Rmd1/YagE family protein